MASTGGGRSGAEGRTEVSVVIARCVAFSSGSAGAAPPARGGMVSPSRTKKPRWRLASTRPWASNWS